MGHDTNVTRVKESPEKEESSRRKKPYHRKVTGDSGVAESLEDAESSFSPADGYNNVLTVTNGTSVLFYCCLVGLIMCLFADREN